MLAGDYNVVATDEVGDIYTPRSLAERRAAPARDAGAPTAASSTRAGPTRSGTCTRRQPIYTYWDYFRNRFARDAGLRIDHLLLNQPAPRLVSAGVDKYLRAREKPSDHAPTWIVLSD